MNQVKSSGRRFSREGTMRNNLEMRATWGFEEQERNPLCLEWSEPGSHTQGEAGGTAGWGCDLAAPHVDCTEKPKLSSSDAREHASTLARRGRVGLVL